MRIKFPIVVIEMFEKFRDSKVATAFHLDYLRKMAVEADGVVELGVNHGASTSALVWCNGHLTSYDIQMSRRARKLQQAVGSDWDFRLEDTTDVDPDAVPDHDLLFVDSLHTFEQVRKELVIFAPKTRKYIIFHDTITFATAGANGETGEPMTPAPRGTFDPAVHGIRLAIDEFMVRNPDWQIIRHDPNSHGLLTLERVV